LYREAELWLTRTTSHEKNTFELLTVRIHGKTVRATVSANAKRVGKMST